MKTKHWKDYERHPISAEYRDITGPDWFRFCLKMKEHGIIGSRKITLHEGKILDGWQLFRACLETNTEPEFEDLQDGMDPRAFVEIVNDERRHETADERDERIARRRERVAEARADGQSLRAIAEKEGVSKDTVASDLKQSPTVYPSTVGSPTDSKITGKDGKERPATRPVILCDRCQHAKNIGRQVRDKCEECAKLREPAKRHNPKEDAELPEPPPVEPDDEILDDDDNPVPAKLRAIFADAYLFRSASAMLAKTAVALERVEKSRAYQYSDRQASQEKGDRRVYSTVCRTAEKKMIDLRPAKICCADGCKKCGNKGYFTQDEIE